MVITTVLVFEVSSFSKTLKCLSKSYRAQYVSKENVRPKVSQHLRKCLSCQFSFIRHRSFFSCYVYITERSSILCRCIILITIKSQSAYDRFSFSFYRFWSRNKSFKFDIKFGIVEVNCVTATGKRKYSFYDAHKFRFGWRRYSTSKETT